MKKIIVTSCAFMLLLAGCGEQPKSVSVPITPAITTNPLQDKPLPSASFTTTLALSAGVKEVKTGEKVSVAVHLAGAQEPVTTVTTTVTFDSRVLKAVEIDKKDSQFPLDFKKTIDNEKGEILLSFSNGVGAKGDNLLVANIVFEGVSVGNGNVKISPAGTMVLLENSANVSPTEGSYKTLDIATTDVAKVKRK